MKTRILIVALWCIAAEHALASPQVLDRIFIGGSSYRIHQTPMSGYWYQDGLPGDGHVPFPEFEFVSFNNWRGYVAQSSISDKKTILAECRGAD